MLTSIPSSASSSFGQFLQQCVSPALPPCNPAPAPPNTPNLKFQLLHLQAIFSPSPKQTLQTTNNNPRSLQKTKQLSNTTISHSNISDFTRYKLPIMSTAATPEGKLLLPHHHHHHHHPAETARALALRTSRAQTSCKRSMKRGQSARGIDAIPHQVFEALSTWQ